MHGIRHAVHNVFKGAVEAVTPVPTVSTFEKARKITPDEFVKAGDYLTGLSRAWVWEGGEATKRVSYLPADKQYLVTKGEGDEWVCTPSVKPQADAAEIPDLAGEPEKADGTEEPKEGEGEDEIPDIDDAEVDEATFNPAEQAAELVDAEAETVRTRTYDLYITYDKFYLTPRFWLVGFDELGRPLPFDKMLEDISEEHARKTITRDPHPHLSMSCAYIHPCKHAHTMKRLGDNLLEQGRGFPVDHYMVVFLKFIASIIPTIEYDYTMSI